MSIKIFADGADLKSIEQLNEDSRISGFTTNPSLLRKAGVTNYINFVLDVAHVVKIKPVSLEVLADEACEMYRQAIKLSAVADNIYVKIPVTNTLGERNYALMYSLSQYGVKVNATAITSYDQIRDTVGALRTDVPSIISIFAGRIADTGRDPSCFISYANSIKTMHQEILWASTREAYNYKQATMAGAQIITMPPEILSKLFGRENASLEVVSLDTVKMFYKDAVESRYKL